MDNLICLKLVTQEEIIGVLKKQYNQGDIRLGNVMVICPSKNGIFLDPYMIAGTNTELEIRAHAIITSSPASEKIVDLFIETSKFNDENAAEATRDKVVN